MFRFQPGCEHRGGVRVESVRTGRRRRREREAEEQHKGSTPKQKQEHVEDELLLRCRARFYHSDLVSSPAANSSHLLTVDDVCAGLNY